MLLLYSLASMTTCTTKHLLGRSSTPSASYASADLQAYASNAMHSVYCFLLPSLFAISLRHCGE